MVFHSVINVDNFSIISVKLTVRVVEYLHS